MKIRKLKLKSGSRIIQNHEKRHGLSIQDNRVESVSQNKIIAGFSSVPTDFVQGKWNTVVQLGRKSKKIQAGKKRRAKVRKRQHEHQVEVGYRHLVRDASDVHEPEKQSVFHQFGDEHRRVDVDPNVDEAPGQSGVHQGGARPDDVDILRDFRVAYNVFDDTIMHAMKLPVFDAIEKRWDVGLHHTFIKEIKNENKKYKELFRNLQHTGDDVEGFRLAFWEFVNERGEELRTERKQINNFIVQKCGDWDRTESGVEWRKMWMDKVMVVNTLLESEWTKAKAKIVSWVIKQRLATGTINIGDVTYIGSLARGYKGPPKQHVRFDPASFDVDANLDAPVLADYAKSKLHLKPDRGRIFGRLTNITPLLEFCDTVEAVLSKHIEGYSSSPGDEFDVAILTDDLIQQQEYNEILERLYDIRENRPEDYGDIVQDLRREKLLNNNKSGYITLREDLTPNQLGKLNDLIQ